MASGNSWERRWALAKFVTFAAVLMGSGLFFITPELASVIASPISLIVLALIGLVSAYMGTATWDDKGN